jgi:hypothetical protein
MSEINNTYNSYSTVGSFRCTLENNTDMNINISMGLKLSLNSTGPG